MVYLLLRAVCFLLQGWQFMDVVFVIIDRDIDDNQCQGSFHSQIHHDPRAEAGVFTHLHSPLMYIIPLFEKQKGLIGKCFQGNRRILSAQKTAVQNALPRQLILLQSSVDVKGGGNREVFRA